MEQRKIDQRDGSQLTRGGTCRVRYGNKVVELKLGAADKSQSVGSHHCIQMKWIIAILVTAQFAFGGGFASARWRMALCHGSGGCVVLRAKLAGEKSVGQDRNCPA